MEKEQEFSGNVFVGGILVIIATIIFGSYGLLVRFIEADTVLLVWAMQIVGVVCFLVYLLKNRVLLHCPRKMLGRIFLMTVFVVIADLSFFMALRATTVSTAVFIKFLMPIIVVALTFRSSNITLKKLLLQIILGTGGLFLILFPQGKSFSMDTGIIWALVTAFTLALFIISYKKISAVVPIPTILFYRYAIASIIILPFILSLNGVTGQISIFWPWLLMFGFLYAIMGTLIHMKGLKLTKVQYGAILGYMEPLSATVMSIIFLNETLTAMLAIGGVLILAGSALSLKEH